MSLDDAVKVADIFNKMCGAIIPLFVLIFGIREYNKWRREYVGKQQMELAQKVNRLSNIFLDRFHDTVSPTFNPEDAADRPRSDNEPSWKAALLDEQHARQKRIVRLFETLGELREANRDAELLFDKNLDGFLDVCNDAARAVSIATGTYFRLQVQYPDTTNERILALKEKNESLMYDLDKASIAKVRLVITEMKSYAKTYFKK